MQRYVADVSNTGLSGEQSALAQAAAFSQVDQQSLQQSAWRGKPSGATKCAKLAGFVAPAHRQKGLDDAPVFAERGDRQVRCGLALHGLLLLVNMLPV